MYVGAILEEVMAALSLAITTVGAAGTATAVTNTFVTLLLYQISFGYPLGIYICGLYVVVTTTTVISIMKRKKDYTCMEILWDGENQDDNE